jgi:hypothetical protein
LLSREYVRLIEEQDRLSGDAGGRHMMGPKRDENKKPDNKQSTVDCTSIHAREHQRAVDSATFMSREQIEPYRKKLTARQAESMNCRRAAQGLPLLAKPTGIPAR